MKKYKLNLYSAEKNFNTGKGLTSKIVKYKNEEEKNEMIKILKKFQKEKNEKFKNNLNDSDGYKTFQKVIYKHINPKKTKAIKIKLDRNTGNTIVIIGSSKSGKSTLMMRIFEKYFNKKKNINTLFSNNAHISIFKGRKDLIKSDNFREKGEKYIKLQKYINSKCKNKYNFINYFDDILEMRYNKILNALIYTYRNSNMSSIINIQYDKLLNKGMRGNINNLFFMSLNTDEAVEAVIRSFLKSAFLKLGIKTMNDMIEFYKKQTLDHGFIYLHPATQTITFH